MDLAISFAQLFSQVWISFAEEKRSPIHAKVYLCLRLEYVDDLWNEERKKGDGAYHFGKVRSGVPALFDWNIASILQLPLDLFTSTNERDTVHSCHDLQKTISKSASHFSRPKKDT